VKANILEHNAWVSGYFGSDDTSAAYSPAATERMLPDVAPAWFPEVPTDRAGVVRLAPVNLGPFER